jgi:hypothetical protein
MSETSVQTNVVRKGPTPGSQRAAPRDPQKILEIVRLRDQQNLKWREIGEAIDDSHQNPYLLYRRWREWAYKEMAKEIAV